MGKQLSTPGKATKVFLDYGLKGETIRKNYTQGKKERKELLEHENTFRY